MLAMASGGLGLTRVAGHWPHEVFWDHLAYQFEHSTWRGCTFWDLIQPSFMFIVGVAMPFSYAKRIERGETFGRLFRHALVRSAILVALGVFLASQGEPMTNFTFTNVLAQIGLGYWFVFLMLGRSPRVQVAVGVTILAVNWAMFALYPLPPDDFNYNLVGVEHAHRILEGHPAHWEMNTNIASDFDVWFLNQFPRQTPFRFNSGGYTTLNFLPSIVTMLSGVLAGEWLRSRNTPRTKILGLAIVGAFCLMAGTAMDPGVCPVVKRIWTPSWVIYSTAWTCWLLAAFYAVIDVAGWRRWSFPLVVVGMNSIVMYLMAQMLKPWTSRQLQTHVGTLFVWLRDTFGLPLPARIFAGTFGPIVESVSVLFVFWLILYALYRRGIFWRI